MTIAPMPKATRTSPATSAGYPQTHPPTRCRGLRLVPDARPASRCEPAWMTTKRDIDATTKTIALAAIAFSLVYFISDAVEAAQGGFSVGQLWLTLVAEAALPVFVLGLAVVQRPHFGRLGWIGATVYAYVYVFFTYTVVYALVEGTRDFDALSHDLRPWMLLHGALMVVAGLCFGIGVIRAGVLPRWTAMALIAGVILVALAQNLPEGPQLVAAGLRDLGFAGMGAALLRAPRPRHDTGSPRRAVGDQVHQHARRQVVLAELERAGERRGGRRAP